MPVAKKGKLFTAAAVHMHGFAHGKFFFLAFVPVAHRTEIPADAAVDFGFLSTLGHDVSSC